VTLPGRLRAALYDALLARSEHAGLAARRAELLAQARGHVLEIGAGTGLNFRHYPPDAELTLTEPDAAMRARVKSRSRRQTKVEVVDASAEQLPFRNRSFDTVVSTLVLCSVDDPAQALAEIRRVLKPDGRLLLLEHVRSREQRRARTQDALSRPWRMLSGGCHCNRDTVNALTNAGFRVASLEHGALPKAPAFLRPLIIGFVTAEP